MKTILRYFLLITMPAGYLVWLGLVLLNSPTNERILSTVSAIVWLLPLISLTMPELKTLQARVCLIPTILMVSSSFWFYLRLTPPEDWNYSLIVGVCFFGLIGITWMLTTISERWPKLSPVKRLIVTVASLSILVGALVFVIEALLYLGLGWHDVIRNWGLTLMLLYPISFGLMFVRRAVGSR